MWRILVELNCENGKIRTLSTTVVPLGTPRLELGTDERCSRSHRSWYTHVRTWLPAINKQKFTPPKLQGGAAIGGVGSMQSFLHCYKYFVVDLRLLCVSEWMLHWFTQYVRHCLHFNQNKVSKRAVCRPYWYERGGGVNIVLFISGSHL